MSNELILLVDDEANIIQLARIYLEREGYRILTAGDGLAALQAIQSEAPDLMVLDVMLPELDGFEVCRQVRKQNLGLPVIMLTARDEDIDKILGLELGADDYLTKPFNPRELVARIRAILRRMPASGLVQTTEPVEEIRLADVLLLPTRREAYCGQNALVLRTQEYEVLLVLARSPGRVFTREELLNLAWGYDFFGQTRTVDVHIATLRRKLAGSQARIETVTGVGYKLVV